MRPLDYVITSFPFSGTAYMASVLTDLGIQAGHEKCFSHGKHITTTEGDAPRGDVSWLAAPFLDTLDSRTVVFHQTRDIYKTLDSALPAKGSLVGEARKRGPYSKFVRRHTAPELYTDEYTEQERVLYWYLIWHEKLKFKTEYAIEDLDPDLLDMIYTQATGRKCASELVCNVLNNTPNDVNTKGPVTPWSYEYLHSNDTPLTQAVLKIAEKRNGR